MTSHGLMEKRFQGRHNNDVITAGQGYDLEPGRRMRRSSASSVMEMPNGHWLWRAWGRERRDEQRNETRRF